MRRSVSICLTLGLLAGSLGATPQEEQTRQTIIRQRQAAMRQSVEQSQPSLRELPGSYHMRDVLQLQAGAGGWVASTRLPTTARNGKFRVRVEGLTGMSVLQITSSSRKGVPDSIDLTNRNFTDAQAVEITTEIRWARGSLSIHRINQFIDGSRTVALDSGAMTDWDGPGIGPGIQFVVVVAKNSGQSDVEIEDSAADFLSLRREHGADIDEHLRPLLRELELESMMAADPLVSWQVFLEEMRPDTKVLSDVQTLLPELDGESFEQRQTAVEKLQSKGLAGAVAIGHLDRNQLSAQQNVLLDAALAPFRPQRGEDVARLRNNVDFLLDCLYADDADTRGAALQCLERKLSRKIAFDIKGDAQQRVDAIESLRGEVTGRSTTRPTTIPAE